MSERRSKKEKEKLGNPRQFRLQEDIESELETFGSTHGIDLPSAVRMALRVGVPILKKKLKEAVESPA